MRVTRNAGPVEPPEPFSQWSNHAVTRSSTRVLLSCPPSWPAPNQSTATGAPFAATAFAIRSPWSSGNSESCCPWTTSVGTLIRSATEDGLDRSSTCTAAASGRPAAATRLYIAHSSSRNRPQPTGPCCPSCFAPVGADAEPVVKKIPAHSFLNTPSAAELPCAACGNSASARFHQVICGAIASIRPSYPAASSDTAPPYEAPVTPTRGSPAPSNCTSGRCASQSTSRDTSATSRSG